MVMRPPHQSLVPRMPVQGSARARTPGRQIVRSGTPGAAPSRPAPSVASVPNSARVQHFDSKHFHFDPKIRITTTTAMKGESKSQKMTANGGGKGQTKMPAKSKKRGSGKAKNRKAKTADVFVEKTVSEKEIDFESFFADSTIEREFDLLGNQHDDVSRDQATRTDLEFGSLERDIKLIFDDFEMQRGGDPKIIVTAELLLSMTQHNYTLSSF